MLVLLSAISYADQAECKTATKPSFISSLTSIAQDILGKSSYLDKSFETTYVAKHFECKSGRNGFWHMIHPDLEKNIGSKTSKSECVNELTTITNNNGYYCEEGTGDWFILHPALNKNVSTTFTKVNCLNKLKKYTNSSDYYCSKLSNELWEYSHPQNKSNSLVVLTEERCLVLLGQN